MTALAFWSLVALIVRIGAIGVFITVALVQAKQFEFKSDLQPLKRLLFYSVVLIAVANIPILLINWARIYGNEVSDATTAFATVTNASGMLGAAILLYLVYRFRGDN
jgi:membrane protein CcdC involved in cytochrome C biogenesis